MSLRSINDAIRWMSNHKEERGGWCLHLCQASYNAPHVHPDAISAWRAAPHKHHDDRPPRGAVVYWASSSHGSGHGHVAISLGDDHIVSTDLPRWGSIGVVPLSTPRHAWGDIYQGWTPTISGLVIPGVGSHAHSGRKDVYLNKLHYTVRNSDSVRRLQIQLNKRLKLNQSHHHLKVDGHYGPAVDHYVRVHQRKMGIKVDPEHRSYVGIKQARRLFGSKKFRIHR